MMPPTLERRVPVPIGSSRRRRTAAVLGLLPLLLAAREPAAAAGDPLFQAFPDIAYVAGGHPLQRLDLFVPAGSKARAPLLVWFHGGALVSGSRKDSDLSSSAEGRWALAHGVALASVDYRLAPEWKYPAQVEDALAAIRFLRDRAVDYGLDGSRIVVWGHSAGAYLALMAAVSGEPLSGVVNWSGPTYLAADEIQIRWFRESFIADDWQLVTASPATRLGADTPPVLTVHGDSDTIIPYSQAEAFYRNLDLFARPGALIRVNNGEHVFQPADPRLPVTPGEETRRRQFFCFLSRCLGLLPAADVNADDRIDRLDLIAVADAQGTRGYAVTPEAVLPADAERYNPRADLDLDGDIDRADLTREFLLLRSLEEEEPSGGDPEPQGKDDPDSESKPKRPD